MTRLEAVLRRDRTVVASALAVLALLCWAGLAALAAPSAGHTAMDHSAMGPMSAMAPALGRWSAAQFAAMMLMWTVMMVGMMTPAAAPMILVYARVARQAAARGTPFAPSGWFALGYFVAWTGFAFLATLAQWGLERAVLLSPGMASASPLLGGGLLIAAGLYQWTPLKDACLSQCQSPFAFIQRHGGFRSGRGASLGLGLRHGAYCIGCCWALMALLFVGGVMNLLWIAAIGVLVLAEKLVPGPWLRRASGVALVLAGAWLLA